MALTNTAVRHAKPRAKDYTLPDYDGLALFVNTNGTKSWHFRFSWGYKQPRISFGTYPEIGLRDACALRVGDIVASIHSEFCRGLRRLQCVSLCGYRRQVPGRVPHPVVSCRQRVRRLMLSSRHQAREEVVCAVQTADSRILPGPASVKRVAPGCLAAVRAVATRRALPPNSAVNAARR